MKLDTFFDNFELMSYAPNGVQRLREMILQLAVHGKLVPQDPKDEPASALLEKIRAEKERLIKEKKIKRGMSLLPIEPDEIPYELPFNWAWVRLDNICSYIQRGKGPKYIDESDIPVISQKCIQWDGFKIERAKFVDPSSIEKYAEERFLQTGDLLWNSTGTGTIGRVNVYIHEENHYDLVVADSHVTVVRPIKINSRYIYIFLASPVVQFGFEDRASGTTNQIELNTSTVKNQIIAVPPVSEQKRIVAKVDELMALCDELEACKQQANVNCIQLNDVSIHKLLTASEPKKFSKHWQRISDNFDVLYSKLENVNKLRQAILQLAVQGKLVPQDPKDEPAHVLFEKIKSERKRLIKEKKIRRADTLTPITVDEIPFKLPKGWEWKKLGELCIVKGGKRVPKGYPLLETKTPFVYIRVTDLKNMTINTTNLRYISKEIYNQIKNYIINKDDVYITIAGTIGAVGEVPDMFDGANLTENAAKLMFSGFNKKYLIWTLHSSIIQTQFQNSFKQMAQPKLALNKIASTFFPLPPLKEQNRIVAKVDELMVLCDELESSLSKSQTDCDRLMEATVAEILAA